MYTCIRISLSLSIYIYIYIYIHSRASAVGSHDFDSQHFEPRVSNPRIIDYVHFNSNLSSSPTTTLRRKCFFISDSLRGSSIKFGTIQHAILKFKPPRAWAHFSCRFLFILGHTLGKPVKPHFRS